MSTNGLNASEDADMAECEGEKVVTMMDVLQEQQEFEDDANAVLGASDDKNCTYTKGYIKRQAIYACLTCCADAKIEPEKRAGVCLACSLNCHENHELIELYTKRNFRCDCGNPKFNGHACQFVPEKPDVNEDNSYNQNFSGVYCVCHRPYPDPEATFEDEMIQCVVCEDWLHASHLEASVPTSDYAEMICKACMEKNEFLHDYSEIAMNNESEDVDILSVSNMDTSVANNTSEINSILENGNAVGIAIDKVESFAETPAKTVLESTDMDGKTKNADVTSNEDNNKPLDDEKSQENIETKDSEVDSKTNSDVNVPNTEKEDSIKENDKNDSSTDKPMATDDQSNSIIESIEKLENELGNVVSEQSGTEADSDKKDEEKPNEQTATSEHITTNEKTENSTETESTKDKQENVESHTTEMEVNEENNKIESESNVSNENSEKETSETILNGESEEKEEKTSDSATKSEENKEDINKEDNKKVLNGTSEAKSSETKTEDNIKEIKRKLSTEDSEEITSKKLKLDANCTRPKGVKRKFKGATFWPCNFRQKLCTCSECLSMYKDLSVLFLTDPEDTVTAYETLGKEKIDGAATSQYEKGLEALSSLDRIQQINALTEYNKMRDKLLDYLKSFKDRKEVVKEEDIKAFFAGMKPKRESDGVYFCR